MRVEKYGASREKLGEAPGQRGLFNEAEAALEVIEAVGMEPELCATPLRDDKASAKSPGRKALPAHLPRIEVRHELPAIERICGCGSALQEIGAETSEQLDYHSREDPSHSTRATEVCVRPLSRRREDRAGAGADSASKQCVTSISGPSDHLEVRRWLAVLSTADGACPP